MDFIKLGDLIFRKCDFYCAEIDESNNQIVLYRTNEESIIVEYEDEIDARQAMLDLWSDLND